MTLEVGKVYSFKLNSGEELVAKVQAECVGNYITVNSPVSVVQGPQGMGLMPSMFTANPDLSVTLNTNSIACYSETDSGVEAKYIEVTTGIKVPEKKIVLG